jgi:small-conductance mechanosensitive channel
MAYRIAPFFILLLALGVPAARATDAAEAPPTNPIKLADQTLTRLEKEPPIIGKISEAQLSAYINQVTQVKAVVAECVQTTEDEINRINSDLATLGDEAAGEATEVTSKRSSLGREAAKLVQRQAQCRLMSLRSKKLLKAALDIQQTVFTRQIQGKGPTFPDVVKSNLAEPEAWWSFAEKLAVEDSGLKNLPANAWLSLFAAGILSLVLGIFGKRQLVTLTENLLQRDGMTGGLVRATLASVGHYLPYLLVSAALAGCLSLFLPVTELPFIIIFSYGAVLFYLIITVVGLVLAPPKPAEVWLPLPENLGHALARRFRVLAFMLLLGFLLFTTLLPRGVPEQILLLARDSYAGFLTLNLAWVTWLTTRIPGARNARRLGIFLTLSLAGILTAQWIGYRGLANFTILGLAGTLLGFGAFYVLVRLLGELFDGLDEGRYRWQRGVRSVIGLNPGEYVPGLNWLRLVANLAIWAGLALWVLRVWGLSDAGFAHISHYYTEGFQIGGISIIPKRMFWALLTLALLLTITRWFRKLLAQRWIKKLRVDRGAQEAIVTTCGYLGSAITLLVTASVAGIDFTNLALVAGALSVGIGFGLQNIVNNFISGLILLIEQRVRAGDRITVGGTEGVVKRISIRYTHLQTNERADVIVPNSEFISSQVTNWMLSDLWGRVRIPIKVAYGADTAKVKEILLEVANAHPLVLRGYPEVPDPQVFFLAFGESTVNFELLCYIRDLDRRLSVTSELNFAIDTAFQEHGIEIPLPQRDVRIHNWPLGVPQEQGGSSSPAGTGQ